MCGLCGVFGMSDHWSDNADGARQLPSRTARAHRLKIAQKMLKPERLTIKEWSGGYMVSTLTGKTAVIDNLGALWQAAEKITGRSLDPLDPAYLARF